MKTRWLLPLSMSAALAACSAPTVPDFTYYRLPPVRPLPESATLFDEPIVVEDLNADGLYADQALVYALDAGADQLREYHYQLWTDPPTRSLQRRLIETLRATHVAPEITDELPASRRAIRISGTILRFDRVPKQADVYAAVASLRIRVDGVDGTPLFDERYSAEKAAAGKDLKATVDAWGAALDDVYGQFYADLRKHGDADRHGGAHAQ